MLDLDLGKWLEEVRECSSKDSIKLRYTFCVCVCVCLVADSVQASCPDRRRNQGSDLSSCLKRPALCSSFNLNSATVIKLLFYRSAMILSPLDYPTVTCCQYKTASASDQPHDMP